MKKYLTITLLLSLNILSCTAPNNLPNPVVSENTTISSKENLSSPSLPKVTLKIKKAEIDVSEADLNKQFKSILELSDEKRIQETNITVLPNNIIKTTGKIVQKLPLVTDTVKIPFTIEGKLSVQPKNIIKFEPTSIKIIGIPVKSLMDVLGVELANFAKFKDTYGRIELSGNNILMIVEKFSNDAIIDGSLKNIQTSDKTITIIF
ncbi:MAG: hypothetical protein U0457_14815 [Candidatus Sericytochromatia bacterium]